MTQAPWKKEEALARFKQKGLTMWNCRIVGSTLDDRPLPDGVYTNVDREEQALMRNCEWTWSGA